MGAATILAIEDSGPGVWPLDSDVSVRNYVDLSEDGFLNPGFKVIDAQAGFNSAQVELPGDEVYNKYDLRGGKTKYNLDVQ